MTELARTYPFLWVDVYIQFIYHRPESILNPVTDTVGIGI